MVEFGQLAGFAMTFVVVGLLLTFGALIVSEIQVEVVATAGDDSHAGNATNETLDALDELASWLPLIAIVLAAVIIISLLIRGFSGAAGR